MKSKKIVAMIVAFAAFMAVATSGFAAVTTTTTYNEIADKVVVDVDVTEATAGSEVTYLVKSGNEIVYIDQKTADETGAVGFDYKIAKDKIVGLSTDVKFGTNGSAAITDTTALYLANVTATVDGNATIAFYTDAACENLIGDAAIVGNSDTIYAKVTVADGFEINTVSGLEETATANIYEVTANAVEVTTNSTYVAPEVQLPTEEGLADMMTESTTAKDHEGNDVEAVQYTQVLKVIGQPSVVGVEYGHRRFPALTADGGAYESGKLYAVRIVVKAGQVIENLPTYCED